MNSDAFCIEYQQMTKIGEPVIIMKTVRIVSVVVVHTKAHDYNDSYKTPQILLN
jgi:hypothetical protein